MPTFTTFAEHPLSHNCAVRVVWTEDAFQTPLLRIVTSLPVMAAILLFPATIMVVNGPTAADQYSLIGAAVAAVITLVAVRKYDQSVPNSICAILGAVTGGVAFPGALVSWGQWKGLVDAHTYAYITWHMWVIMGLVCGLSGWVASQSLYHTLTKVIPGVTDWAGEKLSKFFTKTEK